MNDEKHRGLAGDLPADSAMCGAGPILGSENAQPNTRPAIGRSEGADAPLSRGMQGPASNYSGVFHRSSFDPRRTWRRCAPGACSRIPENASVLSTDAAFRMCQPDQ